MMKSIWTASLHYAATGEGVTVQVWMGYACDMQEARNTFKQHFGEFFGSMCEAAPGIVINQATDYLVSPAVRRSMLKIADAGTLEFYAHAHLNVG